MQVVNTRYHYDLTFDEYEKLHGLSYSKLKSYDRPVLNTPAMQFGTKVHQYLLEPKLFDHDGQLQLIKFCAAKVKDVIGDLWQHLSTEVSVQSDFVNEGFFLPYKGRIDMMVEGRIIVDLKVSRHQLSKTITHFGYDNQLNGYMLSTGIKRAVIIRVCPDGFVTEMKVIPFNNAFWQTAVLKFGKAI